jgi:hypothetical protein
MDAPLNQLKGHSLLELALVLPALIALTLGALDLVHYHRTYNALDQAIEEALRCMGSTDGCQLEASLPPALYSVSAVTADTQLQVPLYDITGTVTGYPLSLLQPTRVEALYIGSAEYTDNSTRQLFERSYTTAVQGTFVTPAQMTLVRNGLSYSIQGGSTHDRTRDILLLPGESASFTIRAPAIPFSSPCIERPLASGRSCSQTEAQMMLLIEGMGTGGTAGTPTIIRLALNGRPLGGREFVSQGSGSVDADFAPRGSQVVQRFIGLPDWQETDTYKSNLLPYGEEIQIRLENISGDASWRLSRMSLVIPRYESRTLEATCDNSLSKEQIRQTKDCLLLNQKERQKLTALTNLKAVTYLQLGEATPIQKGTIKCSENPNSQELFSVPAQCSQEPQTMRCPQNTPFEGISNYGMSPEIEPGSPEWRNEAANLCPVPETANNIRWNVTSAIWENQKLADLNPDSLTIGECSKLRQKLPSLLPEALRGFKNITVTDYQTSELDSQSPQFSEFTEVQGITADMSCLTKRTYAIDQVVDPLMLKGVPHTGCNFPNDLATTPSLPQHVERNISASATGRYVPLSLGTTQFLDKCQEEVGAITTTAIREDQLTLPPLPLVQAQRYCEQHNLTCRYVLAGYSGTTTPINEQIDIAAAQAKASELFSTLVNVKNATFTPEARFDPLNRNILVTMQGSTSVHSLLGSLLNVGPNTISIRKSMISEKSLL